jgi:hypothetical protein
MTVDTNLYTQASKYLFSEDQKQLISDSQTLASCLSGNHINDYSFYVAPMAKIYEGFLKDFFLKIGIIDKYSYTSDRFRVGKTLNPSLRYKRFSIYQKLTDIDNSGEELAETLWTAWKYGRNEIFHFFPHNLKKLTRPEAEERIAMILKAIIAAGAFLDKNNNYNLL